jgi:hypothetical protein
MFFLSCQLSVISYRLPNVVCRPSEAFQIGSLEQ